MAAQGEVAPSTWRAPHRARLRSRRCRACYAFILGDARCERCVENGVSTTTAAQAAEADVLGNRAAKDRQKRLNHRRNHSRARASLGHHRLPGCPTWGPGRASPGGPAAPGGASRPRWGRGAAQSHRQLQKIGKKTHLMVSSLSKWPERRQILPTAGAHCRRVASITRDDE